MFQAVLLKCAKDSFTASGNQIGSMTEKQKVFLFAWIATLAGIIWKISESYSALTKTLKDMNQKLEKGIEKFEKSSSKYDEKFEKSSIKYDGKFKKSRAKYDEKLEKSSADEKFDKINSRFIFAGYFMTASPVVFYLAITLARR